MLHVSETIRHICNVKPDDVATVSSKTLSAELEIDYIVVNLREKRLSIAGLYTLNESVAQLRPVCDMQIEGERGPGRHKTTWMTLKDRDLREWKLNEVDPSDRDV